jgi:hypothetical protein
MTTDEESKAMTLKEQLERGEYQVDTKTVADAVLRSPLWILLTAGTAAGGQNSRPITGRERPHP